MTRPEAERDVIDLETETDSPQSLTKVDPKSILAEFEATSALIPKLVAASIRATRPQDWIAVGDKVYLQGTGVERLASLWGLVFGIPAVGREDAPDGEYSYIVMGSVVCRKTGVGYQGIVGGRSSRDPFFDEFDEAKPEGFKNLRVAEKNAWRETHRIPPDPMEVRKAAVTNWQTRGASMITGMRGLTVADLEANGIKGIKRIEYGSGAKGGDATPADLKAKRTALWNEILKATEGNLELAHSVLIDITKYASYEKNGKAIPAFPGAKTLEVVSDRAIDIARSKLKNHPLFGNEPGSAE
jgi:hypothetical protein